MTGTVSVSNTATMNCDDWPTSSNDNTMTVEDGSVCSVSVNGSDLINCISLIYGGVTGSSSIDGVQLGGGSLVSRGLTKGCAVGSRLGGTSP